MDAELVVSSFASNQEGLEKEVKKSERRKSLVPKTGQANRLITTQKLRCTNNR